MSASISDFPSSWIRKESCYGSHVLLGFVDETIHLLAPPGARIHPDEPDRDRVCWRHAIWEETIESGPPAISVDQPNQMAELGSAEVVEMLPVELHDFVRSEMARQLCRAVTFGEPPVGGRPFDRHAQLADRARAWISSELSCAFPDERWFMLNEPVVHIPTTIDELLAKMPVSDDVPVSKRYPTRWTKVIRRLARIPSRAEYEAFVGLALALRWVGRDGGRSQRLSRKLDRRVLEERDEFFGRNSELTR